MVEPSFDGAGDQHMPQVTDPVNLNGKVVDTLAVILIKCTPLQCMSDFSPDT